MDRIQERDLTGEMFQVWDELVPLIIARSQGSKSTAVKLLLSDLEDSTSDGKYFLNSSSNYTHTHTHTHTYTQTVDCEYFGNFTIFVAVDLCHM